MVHATHNTLYYVDGSPFARVVRVLVREWDVPTDEVLLPFPLPEAFFDLSPLGQVPVLVTDNSTIFPTPAIIAHLTERTKQEAYDTQLLAAVLSWTDTLVAAFYQEWAGLEPAEGTNSLGFDPASRNLERVSPFLDWVAPRLNLAQPSAPEYALACVLWWIESRRPVEWRGRTKIDTLFAEIEARQSFQDTVPAPWSSD